VRGYPDWLDLLEPLRAKAAIPNDVKDLPLLAEYDVQKVPGKRETLKADLLQALSTIATAPSPQPGRQLLAQSRFPEIWTTNHDRLIEEAYPELKVSSSVLLGFLSTVQ
jgi:hypothetical protein